RAAPRRFRRDRTRATRLRRRPLARAVWRRAGDRQLPVLPAADDDGRDDAARRRVDWRTFHAERAAQAEQGVIEDEVRGVLKELVAEIGAVSARIVEQDDIRTG